MPYLFNVLSGFTPTPPGLERIVLRLLPRWLFWGTLLLSAIAVAATIGGLDSRLAESIAMTMLGTLLLQWNAAIGVGIAAFIVMVMKGPAYVADAYWLDDDGNI